MEAVDADYALSETFLVEAGFVAIDANGNGRPPRSPAGVMADVLTALEERHGSAGGYLSASGCSAATLDAARALLLGLIGYPSQSATASSKAWSSSGVRSRNGPRTSGRIGRPR